MINAETSARDRENHIQIEHTGGRILYTGAGIDASNRKIACRINYQLPIAQKMAEGEITCKPRLFAHISFIF